MVRGIETLLGKRDRRPTERSGRRSQKKEDPIGVKKRETRSAKLQFRMFYSQREAEPLVFLWAVESPFGLKREARTSGSRTASCCARAHED